MPRRRRSPYGAEVAARGCGPAEEPEITMTVQGEQTSSSGEDLRGPRGTVLLVDDDEDCLLEMGRGLLGSGHRVLLARTAADGLDLVAQEPVDVVVAAVELPGMGGLQFLDRVRERRPQAVRVVVAGHPDVASAMAAINVEEAFRYLPKPVTSDDLRATLRLAMARREASGGRVVPFPRSLRSHLTEEERLALHAASQERWEEPLAPLLGARGGP